MSSSTCIAFRDLYDEVTGTLRFFADDGVRRHEISPFEDRWLVELIDGFEAEWRAWDCTAHTGALSHYLSLFDDERMSSSLQLAGHVFLHIGYDLPRVIARMLRKIKPPRDRIRLRSLFLRPAPLFRELLVKRIARQLPSPFRRMLAQFKPAEVLGYWILSLRSVAWIQGETLADTTNPAAMEAQLLAALINVAGEVSQLKSSFNIPRLDNSRLFELASPVILSANYPLIAEIGVATAAAATLIAMGYRTRQRNLLIAAQIDHFGALVQIETAKALAPRDLLPPASEGPRGLSL